MRLKTIVEQLNEAVITKPDIPNTMSFWHGGNLDAYDDTIAQKNGRYEYGPGLYIINHYGTAQKYSKGSRKMYIVTVEDGQDINDSTISIDDLNEFVDSYVIGSKRKEIKKRLAEYAKDGRVKAYLFNNMMVNEKAVKGTNTKAWREFLVEQGIDYELVHNPFGWGETMMVLYNMKKIKNIQQVGPKDKIEDYDMLMEAKTSTRVEQIKSLKNNSPVEVYRGTSESGVNFYKGDKPLPFTYYALTQEKAEQYGKAKKFIYNPKSEKTKIFYMKDFFDKFGDTSIESESVIQTLKDEGYDAVLLKGDELMVINQDMIRHAIH